MHRIHHGTLHALLSLILCTVAAPASAADYATLYRGTVEAWQAGDFDRALELQQQAQLLRPDYPGILENTAAIQVRREQPDAAMESLERLAALGYAPTLPMGLYEPLAGHPRWEALLARFEANGAPAGEAETRYDFAWPHFIPEGIAWHAARRTLYLGSIRHGVVMAVPEHGEPVELLGADAGLLSVFGMEVDPRSDMLWIASSRVPEYAGATEVDWDAAILSVDPYSGAVVGRYPAPIEGAVLGDLTLGADGTVYTTDSTGGVYALQPREGVWRTLLAPGVMTSPQGLALHPDGELLYVADYRGGITRIPLDGGEPMPLVLPEGAGAYGIDGMELRGNHLLAVINGSNPHRVLDLHLTPDGDAVDEVLVLLKADPRFDEPTLATVAADVLLVIADSHWNRFGAEGALPPAEELSGPTILAVPLDH